MADTATPPNTENNEQPNELLSLGDPLNRRSFMKFGALATFFTVGAGAALSPLLEWDSDVSVESFLQQHYERLTPEQLAAIMQRLEKEAEGRHGVKVKINDLKPLPEVGFAYALSIGRCVGCRRCVHACAEENNTSRDPEIQYIRVLEMPKGTLNVEEANHDYNHEQVPAADKYYMPVQCHQCDKPPCVKACPVRATWKEEDGIVVIDYNWCIGCRYCEAACPYWARRFNFDRPSVPPDDINPDQAYLSNRMRPRGVMEKCTFCLQRTRQGLRPACAEACPTGARQFGNLLDPESELNYILQNKRVYILKEDAGTVPRFYYWFDK